MLEHSWQYGSGHEAAPGAAGNRCPPALLLGVALVVLGNVRVVLLGVDAAVGDDVVQAACKAAKHHASD